MNLIKDLIAPSWSLITVWSLITLPNCVHDPRCHLSSNRILTFLRVFLLKTMLLTSKRVLQGIKLEEDISGTILLRKDNLIECNLDMQRSRNLKLEEDISGTILPRKENLIECKEI